MKFNASLPGAFSVAAGNMEFKEFLFIINDYASSRRSKNKKSLDDIVEQYKESVERLLQ